MGNDRPRRARRRSVVKPSRNILDDPIDTLNNVVSSDGTARDDGPLVGLDPVQVKSLKRGQSTVFITQAGPIELTVRISALVSDPLISCLFANTSKDAPASLCRWRSSDNVMAGGQIDFTSSWSKACSSSLQSPVRRRSAESTTQTRASVCSK